MGAKTRIAGAIEDAIRRADPRAESVLDLMTGTAVVARTLAGRYRVVANDAQSYAAAIARAHLVHDEDPTSFLASLDAERDLGAAFRKNEDALLEALAPAVAVEDAYLLAAGLEPETPDAQGVPLFRRGVDEAEVARAARRLPKDARERADAYRAFALKETPAFLETRDATCTGPFRGASELFRAATVHARRARPATTPYLLATTYYPNVYLGLRQAIAVDSLRRAIDALASSKDPRAARKRDHYLAALLGAASVATSATSHFCQPRGLVRDAEVQAVLARRALSIPSKTAAFSASIAAEVAAERPRAGSAVLEGDWRAALGPRWDEVRADVVYADPPYTADQYSRFYHVLEVLTRYDHPVLETTARGPTKGRYPVLEARPLSAFCVRRAVEDEMRALADAVAARGAALVLSYGEENGLLLRHWREAGQAASSRQAVERLQALLGESFAEVALERRRLLHSGQGDSNHAVTELLLVARRPRSSRARAGRALAAAGETRSTCA